MGDRGVLVKRGGPGCLLQAVRSWEDFGEGQARRLSGEEKAEICTMGAHGLRCRQKKTGFKDEPAVKSLMSVSLSVTLMKLL